jgi:hypothetical protein
MDTTVKFTDRRQISMYFIMYFWKTTIILVLGLCVLYSHELLAFYFFFCILEDLLYCRIFFLMSWVKFFHRKSLLGRLFDNCWNFFLDSWSVYNFIGLEYLLFQKHSLFQWVCWIYYYLPIYILLITLVKFLVVFEIEKISGRWLLRFSIVLIYYLTRNLQSQNWPR